MKFKNCMSSVSALRLASLTATGFLSESQSVYSVGVIKHQWNIHISYYFCLLVCLFNRIETECDWMICSKSFKALGLKGHSKGQQGVTKTCVDEEWQDEGRLSTDNLNSQPRSVTSLREGKGAIKEEKTDKQVRSLGSAAGREPYTCRLTLWQQVN